MIKKIEEIRNRLNQRKDAKEEPASWTTINGNHVPLDAEGNPMGEWGERLGGSSNSFYKSKDKSGQLKEAVDLAQKMSSDCDKRIKESERELRDKVKELVKSEKEKLSASQYSHIVMENGGDPSSPYRDEVFEKYVKQKHQKELNKLEGRIEELKSAKKDYDKKLSEVTSEAFEHAKSTGGSGQELGKGSGNTKSTISSKSSETKRPKTKLELMKFNKSQHAKLQNDIKSMPDGIEKDVAVELTSKWLSGHNWMGGLSDSVSNKAYEKLMKKGYDVDDIEKEEQRQFGIYG